MTVLSRLALVLVALGLATGLALRLTVGRRALRWALLAALAPVALHLGYMTVLALRRGGGGGTVTTFALSGLVLIALAWWSAWRLAAARPLLAALVPAALALVYSAVPLLLFSRALRSGGVSLDVIPTVVLAGATLFATVTLLVYAPRMRRPDVGRWLRRR